MNRLAVSFAREGAATVAGWKGEVNVSGFTQVLPDMLVQVSEGSLGGGTHCIQFERSAIIPSKVQHKLGPYRH